MFLRLIKKINRLTNKGISNIYSNISYCEKLTFLKLRFSKCKRFIPKSALASSNSRYRYHWIWKLRVWNLQIKNRIKNQWNQKWKMPHTVLERRILCFSSYKRVGSRKGEQGFFFFPKNCRIESVLFKSWFILVLCLSFIVAISACMSFF